jgi:hypothetical protein
MAHLISQNMCKERKRFPAGCEESTNFELISLELLRVYAKIPLSWQIAKKKAP